MSQEGRPVTWYHESCREKGKTEEGYEEPASLTHGGARTPSLQHGEQVPKASTARSWARAILSSLSRLRALDREEAGAQRWRIPRDRGVMDPKPLGSLTAQLNGQHRQRSSGGELHQCHPPHESQARM